MILPNNANEFPYTNILEMVSLCQRTNCQCVNSPTFVLHNSVSVTQNCAVQRLANCPMNSFFFDKVKPLHILELRSRQWFVWAPVPSASTERKCPCRGYLSMILMPKLLQEGKLSQIVGLIFFIFFFNGGGGLIIWLPFFNVLSHKKRKKINTMDPNPHYLVQFSTFIW